MSMTTLAGLLSRKTRKGKVEETPMKAVYWPS
jgi:hypothetical protein